MNSDELFQVGDIGTNADETFVIIIGDHAMAVDQRQSWSRLRLPLKFNRPFAGWFVHCFIRRHCPPPLQNPEDAVCHLPRHRPIYADRYDVVQPEVLCSARLEHRQDPRKQPPARWRVSDPPTRHVNLLSVIGLEQEAKVEDTRSVRTRDDPVAAGTDDRALELWAFERPAQDRDDNPVHTNGSNTIC